MLVPLGNFWLLWLSANKFNSHKDPLAHSCPSSTLHWNNTAVSFSQAVHCTVHQYFTLVIKQLSVTLCFAGTMKQQQQQAHNRFFN